MGFVRGVRAARWSLPGSPSRVDLGVFLHLGSALFPDSLSAGRGGHFSQSCLSVWVVGIKWLRLLKPWSSHQFCFLKRNAIVLRNSGQVAGLYFVAPEK